MRLSKIITTICISLVCSGLYSQKKTDPEYKGYYMFPVRPGEVNFLSGTMGELRSSHFHAAIDIKTSGIQGLPIYAAADGYITRIKISTGGYGNSLYMLHPNGTTTVYAHLQKYDPELARYIRSKQYEQETFEIELFPEDGEFTYDKGGVIGYSGNSGSTSGPHLHWEIRDQNQNVLDPLRYGFKEIKDQIPPMVQKIALVTMDIESRVNGRFGRFEFPVKRNGNTFSIQEPITVWGKIGVEILAHDKLDGASNRNGIPCIDLSHNQEKIFEQDLESFSFSESRNIFVHTNYETMRSTGKRYMKLYVDDGNELRFYQTDERKGVLLIKDTLTHELKIDLWDVYGNHGEASFTLKGKNDLPNVIQRFDQGTMRSDYRIFDNALILQSLIEDDQIPLIEIYANRLNYELTPVYTQQDQAIYLWDLSTGLPDSVNLCHKMLYFNFGVTVPPYRSFTYYHPQLEIKFKKKTLFDTLYFEHHYESVPEANMEIFYLSDILIPMRNNAEVTLKPQFVYQPKEKTAVFSINGKKNYSYFGGDWNENGITFKTRDFGKYTLLVDSIPPTIKPLIKNQDRLSFRIKDELSGIAEYQAEVNGSWVLMNYDYKKDLIWSEKLDPNNPFQGELILKVTDNLGNENIYTTKL